MENAYLAPAKSDSSRTGETDARTNWIAQKEEQARIRKRANDLARCEARIEALEKENAGIDELFLDPEVASDPQKCMDLGSRKAEIEEELEGLYERWEELQEE